MQQNGRSECVSFVILPYYKFVDIMKVNELKALFEKNGVFRSFMPPQPKADCHSPTHIETHPPAVVATSIECRPAPSAPPIPTIQTQMPALKNNDFLNELNKKLMNKSGREKVIENHVHQEQPPSAPEQSPCPPSFRNSFMSPQTNILPPGPAIEEDEISFDDIIGNTEKRSVFRSGLRARLGINERNPSTKEEEEMFSEIQRQSEIESEAQQSREAASQFFRRTRMQAGAYHSNALYSKLSKADKMARIDRILSTIFARKQKELVSKNIASPTAAAPATPAIIKMEPLLVVQAKQQDLSSFLKNEQVLIQNPIEVKSHCEQIPNRSMFAMSKEMLSQMNMKIKKRNDALNNQVGPQPVQQRKNDRSVSPLSKKKKTFQKFEEE